jgi:hypothetical protein
MKTYRYTSYRQMTPWESTQAWSAKHKSMRQEFEQRQSMATSAFSDAWNSQSSGSAGFAAKAAGIRIQAEARQKAADAAKMATYDSGDNKIPATKNSTFSVVASTRLDGGTQINIDSGTMTMKDGSVYDLKTGLKKVNVTV